MKSAKNKITPSFILIFFGLLMCGACGTSSGLPDDTNFVNTEKLTGTPFEGLTDGTQFPSAYFLSDQFRTETIDEFPIKIFTAYFSESEASGDDMQPAIDLANEAMGFEAYVLTETWSDDVRVIYAASGLAASAQTYSVDQYFDGQDISKRISTDWAIACSDCGTYAIAHELAHASGISVHALIDYDNNATEFLEDDSIMLPQGGTALTDYNYMMQRQGQIMLDHLGQTGEGLAASEASLIEDGTSTCVAKMGGRDENFYSDVFGLCDLGAVFL